MGMLYSPAVLGGGEWVCVEDFGLHGGGCSVYRCRCEGCEDKELRWNGEYFLSRVSGLGWVRYVGVVEEVLVRCAD